MATLRLTKPERELIRDQLAIATLTKADARVRESILVKLDESEKPKPKIPRAGVSISAAMEAFREELGVRLVSPPEGASGMYSAMSRRLALLGLTKLDCLVIAKAAGTQWRGQIKAWSLVNQAETLLQSANLTPNNEPTVESAPTEMDEL